jgi:hypothetical protein
MQRDIARLDVSDLRVMTLVPCYAVIEAVGVSSDVINFIKYR